MRTVVTWRCYSDERPPKSGTYLVICSSSWLTTLTYNKEHEAFNWSEDVQWGIPVVYWADLGSIKTLQDDVWNNRR